MRDADAIASEALISQSMPELARALRSRREQIVQRWDRMVRALLPDADRLTREEVADSIPTLLEEMARAMESRESGATEQLEVVTREHGRTRYHESYNVRELIIEYRLLRRILIEEVDAVLNRSITTREWLAIDAAIDLSLQGALLAFLEYQSGQLKAAAETESKFLAFLAHEMRGGLNSVLMTMQWVEQALETKPDLVEEKEGLAIARKSAIDTVTSLERLLQAERMRHKGLKTPYATLTLAAVAQRVAAQFCRAAGAKGLALHVLVPEAAKVRTDDGLLSLILQNLVGNAIKYSDAGAVTIDAIPHESGGWLLRVSDQGRGIPGEALASIFDAFTRGANHGEDGTGLGLFIASQAAFTIGARLNVESTVGRGSTFSILFPPVIDT